jgi:hypothetical protein
MRDRCSAVCAWFIVCVCVCVEEEEEIVGWEGERRREGKSTCICADAANGCRRQRLLSVISPQPATEDVW